MGTEPNSRTPNRPLQSPPDRSILIVLMRISGLRLLGPDDFFHELALEKWHNICSLALDHHTFSWLCREPFTFISKRIKYLGLNLTNEVKDLYSKNCRTPIKEIEDTNIWNDTSSWTERTTRVKMYTLAKAIYRFNASLLKHQKYLSQN